MKLIAFVPLLPLLGFLFNFTVGVRLLSAKADGHGGGHGGGHGDDHGGAHHGPHPLIGWVACGSVFGAFLLAVVSVLQAHAAPDHALLQTVWTWLPAGEVKTAAGAAPFHVDWAYLVDPLSSVMVLIVTFVGF